MPDEPNRPGLEGILSDLAGYHAGMLARHGATPGGVGWNGPRAQQVRFEQVARVITPDGGYSVNDFGCGYGAFYQYLAQRHSGISYHGFDISPEMVAAARQAVGDASGAEFFVGSAPRRNADYGIASGLFSMKLGRGEEEWQAYVKSTLDLLHRTSDRGFAFNSLTRYSDPERMRPELHYADPCELFDHCKRSYSRNVALLHDYDLYDFTILVRKAV